jgi:hypothetical protein
LSFLSVLVTPLSLITWSICWHDVCELVVAEDFCSKGP